MSLNFDSLKAELKQAISEETAYSNVDNAKKRAVQQCNFTRHGL